jgi:hypothetical protein
MLLGNTVMYKGDEEECKLSRTAKMEFELMSSSSYRKRLNRHFDDQYSKFIELYGQYVKIDGTTLSFPPQSAPPKQKMKPAKLSKFPTIAAEQNGHEQELNVGGCAVIKIDATSLQFKTKKNARATEKQSVLFLPLSHSMDIQPTKAKSINLRKKTSSTQENTKSADLTNHLVKVLNIEVPHNMNSSESARSETSPGTRNPRTPMLRKALIPLINANQKKSKISSIILDLPKISTIKEYETNVVEPSTGSLPGVPGVHSRIRIPKKLMSRKEKPLNRDTAFLVAEYVPTATIFSNDLSMPEILEITPKIPQHHKISPEVKPLQVIYNEQSVATSEKELPEVQPTHPDNELVGVPEDIELSAWR